MSPGRRLDNVLKKVVSTSISDQSRTYLRPKLRRFYDVIAASLCRLDIGFETRLVLTLSFIESLEKVRKTKIYGKIILFCLYIIVLLSCMLPVLLTC